jgi:hypothetical protein
MTLQPQATFVLLLILAISLFADPSAAYVGPGAGLTALGAFLSVIVGIIVAILGFIWYPIKRLVRKRKGLSVSENRGG